MRYLVLLIALMAASVEVQAAEKKLPKVFRSCSIENVYDGYGIGFTWKPLAEHWPVALVLLPSRFVQHTRAVKLYTMKGKNVGPMTMKGDGVCEPGQKECLYRPSFKGSMSGLAYARRYKAIMVKVWGDDNKCYIYPVSKPWQRVD